MEHTLWVITLPGFLLTNGSFLSVSDVSFNCLPATSRWCSLGEAALWGSSCFVHSLGGSQLVTSVCPARHCAIAGDLPKILPGCKDGGEMDSWGEREHLHAAHPAVLCKALLPWHPCRQRSTRVHLEIPVPRFFFSSSPWADQVSGRG